MSREQDGWFGSGDRDGAGHSNQLGELTSVQVSFDDYKLVLFRNQPDGWVTEIPAIAGCYALMPTREEALTELANVFHLIADEYAERNQPLPADTTAIVNA